MKISGKILEIGEIQNISETFKKRVVVVEYKENPQYPQYLPFELIQDKCSVADGFHVGQNISISFNLNGRKWTDKTGAERYFVSLQAWRFDDLDSSEEKESQRDQDNDEEDIWGKKEENDAPF